MQALRTMLCNYIPLSNVIIYPRYKYQILSHNSWIISSIPYPDSKVHGANMGPTLVLSAPDGPHVGPMNIAIRVNLLPVPESIDEIMRYLDALIWNLVAACKYVVRSFQEHSRHQPRSDTPTPQWRHQMETFSALLAICAGNSPVSGEFPAKASDAELWYFLWSAS